MQRTSSNESTYIPQLRQKNAAVDAVSLLAQMAIPQIDVNPTTQSIKTSTGQPVSIFIDYVTATAQDLSGMRPTDVKRVEYLLYPQDPRFRGAQYVLNFVMQKYEWGGYTKLHANKWFGVNRTEGSVYSKFAYKSMTFDFFANDTYLTNRHIGTRSTEIFRLPDFHGMGEQTIQRTSEPGASSYRNNSNDVTFRAIYSSDKVQISNMLSFNNTSIPRNNAESSLAYSNGFMPSSTSKKIASSHSRGLNYNFEAYTSFSQNVAMNIEAAYIYGHNKSRSYYSDNGLNIVNNANENTHSAWVSPTLVWNPNEHNSIAPLLHAEYYTTSIDYMGNSPSFQKYDIWGYVAGARYTYRHDNWSAGGLLGWVFANTCLSGTRINSNYPQGNVFATYSPDNHHQIEARYSFGKTVPETYQKSPNMLQQDELMWYCGNPFIKDYWNNTVNLTYTWLPNNRWQFTANGSFYKTNDRVVTQYTPNGPDGALLRQYVNDGFYRTWNIGMNVTAKFFGGKLVAKLNPDMWFRSTSGEYAMTYNELTCTAQLMWYLGNFYLWGWYMTPSTYPDEESGIKERTLSQYQVQLGYGKGAWRVSASAYNFLHSSWETSRQTLVSQYYEFNRRQFGTAEHSRFQLSLTYTFGYGKKVQRGDEVSGVGLSESSILK